MQERAEVANPATIGELIAAAKPVFVLPSKAAGGGRGRGVGVGAILKITADCTPVCVGSNSIASLSCSLLVFLANL